jgi:hypothetical protein
VNTCVHRDECSYSYVYEYLRLYCVSIKKACVGFGGLQVGLGFSH